MNAKALVGCGVFAVCFLTPWMPQAQSPARAQSPAFDVVSIKAIETVGSYRLAFPTDGSFSARVPLEWLISVAYDIRPLDRIVGEPAWVRTQWFDVEAKPAGSATREQRLAMLRTMIEERFGLVWRKDPFGTATVYALMLSRNGRGLGPGIRPAQIECLKSMAPVPPVFDRQLRPGVAVPCGSASANGVHAGGGLPPRTIASILQLALGEEVVDQTGLSGNFDYYLSLPDARDIGAPELAAAIFTAAHEQLGMRLQREEIPRDVFIVERVSPPTPN